MPLCVHCGSLAKSLYATYGPTNIVCTPCAECKRFADPYLEHDFILVVLDLILVKPRAYRHLLFNRNASGKQANKRQISPWLQLARWLTAVILIDAYLRWYTLCANPGELMLLSDTEAVHAQAPLIQRFMATLPLSWPSDATAFGELSPLVLSYVSIWAATAAEVLTLHATILLLVTTFRLFKRRGTSTPFVSRSSTPDNKPPQTPVTPTKTSFASTPDDSPVGDGAEVLYEPRLVPNALLLSTLTPIFLLLLTVLWKSKLPPTPYLPTMRQEPSNLYQHLIAYLEDAAESLTIEFAVRNLIGGVSAGVALAVLLPSQPFLTVCFLTAGWYAQTFVRLSIGVPLADAESFTDHARRLWCPAV